MAEQTHYAMMQKNKLYLTMIQVLKLSEHVL